MSFTFYISQKKLLTWRYDLIAWQDHGDGVGEDGQEEEEHVGEGQQVIRRGPGLTYKLTQF